MGHTWESFKVAGEDVLKRVRQLVHEGNVRRVVIKQDAQTVVQFPVTVGVVGALVVPELAVIGTLAALLTRCSIGVERQDASAPKTTPGRGSRRKA